MKLGTQTNSLVNHTQSRQVIGQPEPEVGMGATLLSYTDRKAGTIQKVEKRNGVTYVHVTIDEAKRVDSNGMSEDQIYEFTPRPDGHHYKFKKTKEGFWKEVYINPETGRFKQYNGGKGLRIGVRDEYYDFSF